MPTTTGIAKSLSMSLSTHISKGVERLHRMRDVLRRGGWYRPTRRHSGDFTNRNVENVFVESCRALGARGNGRSLPPATPRSSRSRERRAHGEERPASVVSHEQEVRRPRSGFAVVPHSLIRTAPPSFAYATMGGCKNPKTLVGKPAGVFSWWASRPLACSSRSILLRVRSGEGRLPAAETNNNR